MSLGLTVVAIGRIVVGIGAVLAPSFTAYAISLPYHASASSLSYRWAGGRELALGGWLWLMKSGSSEQLTSVLIVSAFVDVIDIASAATCVLLEGNLDAWALTIVAGGAAGFLAIELWTLSGLRMKGKSKAQ